jgi:hypothetical protein
MNEYKEDIRNLVTLTTAAKIRKTSIQAVFNLVKREKLESVVVGGRRFYRRHEVEQYKHGEAGRPKGKRT